MKPVAMLIVQNSFPDILRCLDSLVCCSDIYICDGGSSDGSREWLDSVEDIYNLHIFDRPFDTMQKQRNYLLEKVPKNRWCVNIDQDEALNPCMTYCLEEYFRNIPANFYEDAKKEDRVLVLDTPYLILKDDYKHYCFPYTYLRGKVFYNSPGLSFYHPYHSEVSYSEDKMSQYLGLSVPSQFAIFHYAFFYPKRHKERKKRLEKLMEDPENKADWEYEQWFKAERDVREVPEEMLPPY